MTRKPQTAFVRDEYWADWFGRIEELFNQTENIINYSSYIYKMMEKEGFKPK
jgi:hypothetical protein